VYCIDRQKTLAAFWAGLSGLCVLAGCASSTTAPPVPTTPARSAATAAAPAGAAKSASARALPAPGPVRNWNEVRAQAALRMVAANPDMTYMGEVPDTLLAIPVLEVELNADGSIRRIEVMRHPRQALDTVKLATDAVHRAAPFGDVSRLPKPWRFTETFLFNDDRKFKPRTLD
jgi:hypothetical protein